MPKKIENETPEPMVSIAQTYLKQHEHILSSYEREFLKAMDKTYYGFYQILEVVPDQRLRVRDILLQTEQLLKQRQREEEEYRYQLDQERRKEQDAYEARQTQLEKDLAQRLEACEEKEKNVQSQEQHVKEKQGQLDQFPAELEKAVAQGN